MMKVVLSKAISRLKGEKFEISDKVSVTDLLLIIYKRLIMLLRGIIKTLFINKNGVVFVGKGVGIYHKKYLKINGTLTIDDYVTLNCLSEKGVIIGNNVKIGKYSIINCTGSIKEISGGIFIGDNTSCGEYCFFGAGGFIHIGSNVIMGQKVNFHAENHNFNCIDKPIREQGVNRKGIKIEDDCWIGSGVYILDGVTVGKGCIIGAGAVVNKSIAPYSIAVGNPAKVVKFRNKEQNI